MKRMLALALLLAIVLPVSALYWVGISPFAVGEAMRVGTGMTAKLGCSGIYLSGFSEEDILRDLASYSPAANVVSLKRLEPDTVAADISGMATATARFIPGQGCTLAFPGMIDRQSLSLIASANEREDRLAVAVDAGVQTILEQVLSEDSDAGLDTRALLVLKNGELIAQAYRDGITAETPLLGWSMAKSVTAILLGRMEAMGLADPASQNLFPAWQNDDRRAISVLNMLQMSSGLAFEEIYGPGSDATRMLFTVPDASAIALQKSVDHAPGEHFAYSSGTTNLLMRYAMQQLGGEPQDLLSFWQEQIVAPLGLTATTFEMDASGVFVGSSYLYAPASDWARMGQLMLDDGVVGGKRLLPQDWVARAQAPNNSKNDPRYGYQFWLNAGTEEPRWPDLEAGAYAMMGNRGQVVMILPEHGAVVVRLGWSAAPYPYNAQLGRIQAVL
ncbi:class C beta-lactamase-related serine hydrolase [Halioglobus maricola]|uniref:Class C beta-lactamase-related serine hydrolase n=1 Tax=Halioglobus maricola TaxID=2601894 RepID=A0A5P9NLB3_9GAMM|nr:serine hydrolase [Halioglobus maricola]QFU76034.1 class C beta-lactamase-related serine hydrolase [Halioglobus maricola]